VTEDVPTPEARLRAAGVRDVARALPLVAELFPVFRRDDPVWGAIWAAAAASPDPNLFFLNLSHLNDALAPDVLRAAFADARNVPVVGALLGGSEFLTRQVARRPRLFAFLFSSGGVHMRMSHEALMQEAQDVVLACETEEQAKQALREIKWREIARIAARDLSGLSDLTEVMADLSALASAALDAAVVFGRRQLDVRYGAPWLDTAGGRRPARFVVLGMGKLGGFELNFSSDIDLIYFYETDRGATDGEGGGQPVSFHEYFVRLSESITRIVSEVTEDGFVFRIDLRLRPEGSKGDLACSLRSAEIYYETSGMTWERGALVKARPVAGDRALGDEFLRIVSPFVFRKYLDFTAIEEIKEMKDKINLENARKRIGGKDLKLGIGGIREIEFFVTAHQLVYGGKLPELRLRGTMETLRVLRSLGTVSPEECATLETAYDFLRRLEHRIQVFGERQTHVLPDRDEDLFRLARAMGLQDGDTLLSVLSKHGGNVQAIYGRLFGGDRREADEGLPAELALLLDAEGKEAELASCLSTLGFADGEAAVRHLAALRERPTRGRLSARARRYLDKIIPMVLARVLETPDPDSALAHFERFLTAVGGRTMYYALLFENRKVIETLARLFGSSPFLSGYLLQHPELLDLLLRHDIGIFVKSKSELRRELGELLSACTDLEQEMDELRRYKHVETLRIGIHELAGELLLEEATFQHSALAEVLLGVALNLAEREVRRRFGRAMLAPGEDGSSPGEAAFCVVGMGKLGAEELSYHSDLDIIFLYEGAGETEPVPGEGDTGFRKLGNHEYFAKIAQRLIFILTMTTREGAVYKLDTRLRPSGNSGPLVSSMAAFRAYHETSAQLWERQAMLKSRFVAGDREFGKRVEAQIRGYVYERPLPPDAASEIHRLRKRMEVELGRENDGRLNLKVGRGGVVDVEFATQYLQLVHGPGTPSVRTRSTLKALYELWRAGAIDNEKYRALEEGYRFLRGLEVRLRLTHDASIEQFDPSGIEPGTMARYREETERVRRVFLEVLGIGE
jgi:[glutamine synthetase] adenylyltransferase / [glutamine synthetase]-adenylyl-L-tyrosine phosphorylase